MGSSVSQTEIIVSFATMLSCLKMNETGVAQGQRECHCLVTFCGDPVETPFTYLSDQAVAAQPAADATGTSRSFFHVRQRFLEQARLQVPVGETANPVLSAQDRLGSRKRVPGTDT